MLTIVRQSASCTRLVFINDAWIRSASSRAPAVIRSVVKKKLHKNEKILAHRFVDFRAVRVCGGKGGDGCLSFLSLPCNERAGPDGGNGGNGGHVIFQADSNVRSLINVNSVHEGEEGVKGRNNHMHGKNSPHTYIKVPVGTMFIDEENNLVADLKQQGDLFVAARGGAGGHGNHFFVSSEDRAPRTYEKGGLGEEKQLYAELRLMAHVGLVGFPNAGKSTLLRAISKARPKVASYPFTTLNPHVGIVEYPDHEQVAVADVPGLIPGAHLNHGLGADFLRHVERCACLLYVLDLAQEAPATQLQHLRTELHLHVPGLADRPHAIVANKIDLPMAEENLKQLRDSLSGVEVFPISAKRKVNIEVLVRHIRELYDKHGKHKDSAEE